MTIGRVTGGGGLDAFTALVAAIQTGFGAFMAAYLSAHGWGQTQIGVALSMGTMAVLLTQFPAGLVVDAARDVRLVARLAAGALAGALLLIVFWPARVPVYAAMTIQGVASALMEPTIAALSMVLVGHAMLGERLGRNTRFASIGNGVTAAAIGVLGASLPDQLVLAGIAAMILPAWLSLSPIAAGATHNQPRNPGEPAGWREIVRLARNPRLSIFAVCVGAFHLANAGMLPLAASALARQNPVDADRIVALTVMVPTIVAALAAPAIGGRAQAHGRRGLLLAGWLLVAAQGAVLAVVPASWLLPLVFVLGGMGGTIFSVMLPLVAADLSRGTRHFTLCVSSLTFPVAVGATFSTTLSGLVADRAGDTVAFLGLAFVGLSGTALLWLAMPETRVIETPSVRRQPAGEPSQQQR